ncbi:hypothetical protein H9P43_007799 [Blastocladiella emersonii ATCC 22665]|nr:hypothetical protein H9P43_007799 [Blastocladiella emersonii ATCC 22665]
MLGDEDLTTDHASPLTTPMRPLADAMPAPVPLSAPPAPGAAGHSSYDTPRVNRLDAMDLRHLVRDLKRQLYEQTYKLQQAGTIGQSLLRSNEELLRENERLVGENRRLADALEQPPPPPGSSVSHVQSRRSSVAPSFIDEMPPPLMDDAMDVSSSTDPAAAGEDAGFLRLQNRHLAAEMDVLRDQLADAETQLAEWRRRHDDLADRTDRDDRTLVRQLADARDRLGRREAEVEVFKARVAELEAEKQRLAEDKLALVRNRNELSASADVVGEYADRNAELEAALHELAQQYDDAVAAARARNAEAELLEERVEVLESQVDELTTLRTEHQETQLQVDTLTGQLEDAREQIRSLQRALHENVDGEADAVDDPANRKTLLSEVDDQRRSIEERNARLAREHERTLHRQIAESERLRRQVYRLTQLSSDRAHTDHIKRLESQLAALQSENRELAFRVDELENMQRTATAAASPGTAMDVDGGSSANNASAADSAVTEHKVRYLTMRVEQLETDLRQAKKKMQTSVMMRQHEVWKLRAVEDEVYQRDTALARLNTTITRLRFRIDELEANCDCPKPASRAAATPSRAGSMHAAAAAAAAAAGISTSAPAPASAASEWTPLPQSRHHTHPHAHPHHYVSSPTPPIQRSSSPVLTAITSPVPAARNNGGSKKRAATPHVIRLDAQAAAGRFMEPGETTPGSWEPDNPLAAAAGSNAHAPHHHRSTPAPTPARPRTLPRAPSKVVILPKGGVDLKASLPLEPAAGQGSAGDCRTQ